MDLSKIALNFGNQYFLPASEDDVSIFLAKANIGKTMVYTTASQIDSTTDKPLASSTATQCPWNGTATIGNAVVYMVQGEKIVWYQAKEHPNLWLVGSTITIE